MRGEEAVVTTQVTPVTALNLLACQASDADRLRAFWRRVERFTPGSQIRLGAPRRPPRRVIVVSGWACELRLLADGRRQIFGFLLPGDVIDERSTANIGSRGVIALTRLEVVDADSDGSLAGPNRERIREALNLAALERESRLYDHLTRMGRLSARERVLHLLLELRERVERVGLLKGDSFRIPLTQEVFADALGLSIVHISRTLKQLRNEGLVTFHGGSVTLRQPEKLAALAHYQSFAEDSKVRRLDGRGGAGEEANESWAEGRVGQGAATSMLRFRGEKLLSS